MNSGTRWTVPLDHPAFAGHFPGTPILPGVVLLDAVLHHLATASGATLARCRVNSVKFLSPVTPGEELLIQCTDANGGTIRFAIQANGRQVASGVIDMEPAA